MINLEEAERSSLVWWLNDVTLKKKQKTML